jgi:hypothetical protein
MGQVKVQLIYSRVTIERVVNNQLLSLIHEGIVNGSMVCVALVIMRSLFPSMVGQPLNGRHDDRSEWRQWMD